LLVSLAACCYLCHIHMLMQFAGEVGVTSVAGF
jgi:hypothetical protein